MVNDTLVALFAHTSQGSDALHALLSSGVARSAIHVVGDLGEPAGQTGAMHHVTFDALHIPKQQHDLFMDGIRSGGVVLAIQGSEQFPQLEATLRHSGAILIEHTDSAHENASHNLA